MRRGTTLTELLLALVVLAVTAALVVPKVAPWVDRAAVERSARAIASAQTRARLEAAARGTVLIMTIGTDSLRLEDRLGARLWQAPGPGAANVALAPAGHQVTYAPSGLALGFSNVTLRLSRGSAQRRVVISRMGRVRVLP